MRAKKTSPKLVEIMQDEKPIPHAILASSIVAMSRAAQQLKMSGLSERAVVLLVSDMCPNIGIRDITMVLRALQELEKTYVKGWKIPVRK